MVFMSRYPEGEPLTIWLFFFFEIRLIFWILVKGIGGGEALKTKGYVFGGYQENSSSDGSRG